MIVEALIDAIAPKPDLAAHCSPPSATLNAISASRRENVPIKTHAGKLAPMGAALVAALAAANATVKGDHKGRPYEPAITAV